MRQIFLDTETTGLSPEQGHRIIEIAAIEVVNRRVTDQHFHVYLNPEREIDAAAQEVHGITLEFLQDKPFFSAVAEDLVRFLRDAELIIHNAPFDVGFLNSEFGRIGLAPVQTICDKITDTLVMAKEMRPGQRNNLDALCRHYGVDNARRTLHGALLDAELLAEVYMAMTRGQESLMMDLDVATAETFAVAQRESHVSLKVLLADQQETEEHRLYLEGLAKAGAKSW